MKKELIETLFARFEQTGYEYQNIKYWNSSILQSILGYSCRQDFMPVIEKAKKSCEAKHMAVSDHFADIGKMIRNGPDNPGDFALTRQACYFIAKNSDPEKDAVIFAQTYFAIEAYEVCTAKEVLQAFTETHIPKKVVQSVKFTARLYLEGKINDKIYAVIRSKGDQALFGGYTTREMKKKLMVPENRALADFLPTLTIVAKSLAFELTNHNAVVKNLQGEVNLTREHVDNNTAVRKILLERGVIPEKLPPVMDIKKVKKQIEKEDKHALNHNNRKDEQ